MPNSPDPILNNKSKTNVTVSDVANKAKNGNHLLKFNTATTSSVPTYCSTASAYLSNDDTGPLVDSGATYSAIGIVELASVTAGILPE